MGNHDAGAFVVSRPVLSREIPKEMGGRPGVRIPRRSLVSAFPRSDFQISLMRQSLSNRYHRTIQQGDRTAEPVEQSSHREEVQPCSDYAIS